MLETISWGAYLQYSAIATAAYYTAVGGLYYRKEILAFVHRPGVSREPSRTRSTPDQPVVVKDGNRSQNAVDGLLFSRVHELSDELNALLLQSAADEATESTITANLQRLLQKYPDLKGSSFQESIYQMIYKECETQCGDVLSHSTIASLW